MCIRHFPGEVKNRCELTVKRLEKKVFAFLGWHVSHFLFLGRILFAMIKIQNVEISQCIKCDYRKQPRSQGFSILRPRTRLHRELFFSL